MKIKLIILILLVATSQLFSQDMNQILLVHGIDGKTSVTYGDAVKLFALNSGISPSNFNAESAALKKKGLPVSDYPAEKVLTKGMAAKLAAAELNLKGSLFYIFFKSERYAFRACQAEGIFDSDSSEYDKMSGPDLIELISGISERTGK